MVLGINAGPDPMVDLEAFVSAFQVSFPILLDDQAIINIYRQSGSTSPFPLDYIVDQEGRVAYYNTEYDPAAMITVIEELLDITTLVEDQRPPAARLLLQAAPNPFNPMTTVTYAIPVDGPVTLELHDARGRRVRRLLAGERQTAGRYKLVFDGRDDVGRDLPTGLYLLRMTTSAAATTRKLMLVR